MGCRARVWGGGGGSGLGLGINSVGWDTQHIGIPGHSLTASGSAGRDRLIDGLASGHLQLLYSASFDSSLRVVN